MSEPTIHPERPSCAGWHEPDPTCDGGSGEPPCAYRERCLALITIAGGKAKRTTARMTELLDEWDDDRLDEWFAEREEATRKLLAGATPRPSREPSAPPTAVAPSEPTLDTAPLSSTPYKPPTAPAQLGSGSLPIPGYGEPVKRHRPARDIHPRPSPRYDHVLPLVDALLDRLALELGRRVTTEADKTMRVGDLFVRYTPGMGGRLLAIYEATNRKTYRHRLIVRIILVRRESRMNMKSNCTDLPGALRQAPPNGVVCRLWKDVKPAVTLVGVDAHAVRDSASWLARVYNAGLIEGNSKGRPIDV